MAEPGSSWVKEASHDLKAATASSFFSSFLPLPTSAFWPVLSHPWKTVRMPLVFLRCKSCYLLHHDLVPLWNKPSLLLVDPPSGSRMFLSQVWWAWVVVSLPMCRPLYWGMSVCDPIPREKYGAASCFLLCFSSIEHHETKAFLREHGLLEGFINLLWCSKP